MNKKIAVIVLMGVAAIFLTIPLISINKSLRLKKSGVSSEGTVLKRTSKKGLSTVTVSFTAEGKQLTASASKRGFVTTGEKVMLYYDPSSPENIDFGDTVSYNMRGVIAGAFLFLIGFYYFIRYSFMDNARKRLIKTGQKIAAEFVSVDRNEKYRMGENNPWLIRCRWKHGGNNKEYQFVSKDYLIDPAPYLKGRNHLDVFIDPNDPGRYFMDTSFMPDGNNTIG